jgi:hypothetical protein
MTTRPPLNPFEKGANQRLADKVALITGARYAVGLSLLPEWLEN